MKTKRVGQGRKRRSWTRHQKHQMVKKFDQSGQKATDFCRVQGIHSSMLARWRREIKGSLLKLEPLTLMGPVQTEPPQAPHCLEVETPTGVMIRVRQGCEGKLFKQVWACCCV